MEALSPFCDVYRRGIEILGRRWTGAILRALMAGRTRFNDIAHTVPGLSDRLLSERLKELETEGLVTRAVTPCTPVRVDYTLTEAGEALVPVVRAVAAWAETWLPAPAARSV
ncbi:MAG: winged helix-turn-helix transcriptional regulator [Actinomycetota bacterium]